ncbi:MAG: hypothetical protein ACQCN4_10885, partial [Candidatus Bathyarchaeia archaeon]
MGFIDYAWATSLQKDNMKVKILQDENLEQPVLLDDPYGFTLKFPTVSILKDGTISFLGHKFPGTNAGKTKVGRLFRASVVHLTTHTLAPFSKDRVIPSEKDSLLTSYAKRLVNDTYNNAYIAAWYPDRFFDIAYANALAYQKIKKSEHIFTQSTRIMSAVLTQINLGSVKGALQPEEQQVVDRIAAELSSLKEALMMVIAGDTTDVNKLFDEKVKAIKDTLEPFGPFLDVPSLRHTEAVGRCSIYSAVEASADDFEGSFVQSLMALGSDVPTVDNIDQLWRSEQESESLQAFNSEIYQKQRNEKILAKLSPYLGWTRFKKITIPEEDYTQYLRARSLVQGTSRRLLDILRSAFNYLDEDPRQEMGQLDLTAVIQSLASNKPATDVFNLDEYLKPSFAWSLLL